VYRLLIRQNEGIMGHIIVQIVSSLTSVKILLHIWWYSRANLFRIESIYLLEVWPGGAAKGKPVAQWRLNMRKLHSQTVNILCLAAFIT